MNRPRATDYALLTLSAAVPVPFVSASSSPIERPRLTLARSQQRGRLNATRSAESLPILGRGDRLDRTPNLLVRFLRRGDAIVAAELVDVRR